MGKKLGLFVAILTLLSFISGCSYWSAKKEIQGAESLMGELTAAGAMGIAPYEYKSAEKLLENAKGEFGENDFEHAKIFATESKTAAEAGLANSKQ